MSPEKLDGLKEQLRENILPQHNIGLKNVVTRMELLYSDNFEMNISSAPGNGSSFTLKFPFCL